MGLKNMVELWIVYILMTMALMLHLNKIKVVGDSMIIIEQQNGGLIGKDINFYGLLVEVVAVKQHFHHIPFTQKRRKNNS
jgi:hypothetical protein